MPINFLCICNLRADDLSSDLCLQGVAVQSLHGDREQCDREEALKDFKESMLKDEEITVEGTEINSYRKAQFKGEN